jgi:hypothetical protein
MIAALLNDHYAALIAAMAMRALRVFGALAWRETGQAIFVLYNRIMHSSIAQIQHHRQGCAALQLACKPVE